MCTNSSGFYSNLVPLKSFNEASDPENYHSLPDDWFLAVSDIVDSTSAIKNKKYKLVNILGASPIVGILNKADKNSIPYTFAGDGCAFALPPQLVESAQQVLSSCKKIGKAEYGLDLRAAVIPLSYLRNNGYDVKVAVFQASSFFKQALFSGGGINFAENQLKSDQVMEFVVKFSDSNDNTDFSGLECRWQEVGQKNKEVITILIKCIREKNENKVYNMVFQKLQTIFGFDEANPVYVSGLNMNTAPAELMGELKFRSFGRNGIQRLLYLIKMEWEILLGKIFMATNYKSKSTEWDQYKSDIKINSDYRKFDDMLRMVISGSKDQRLQLQEFLEDAYQNSMLAYGLHISESAIITCMVFQYQHDHIHFVDGSNGGYVAASKELKKRMFNHLDSIKSVGLS